MLLFMKTLHFTNAWHATSGGIATFYRALIAAANERQHLVRLVVPDDRTWVEEMGRFGRIYHLRAPRAPFNTNYRVLYSHRSLLPGTLIHSILADERPDLVEVCDKYTLNYLAGLLRMRWIPGMRIRPTIVALSCERMDDNVAAYITPWRLGRWLSRVYMKWLYFPLFDHHITVSEYTAEELSAAASGHRVQRGVWIRPMGVDLEGFSPGLRHPEKRRELIERLGGGANTAVLLYAGRLVPEKNLPLLVETMEALRRDGRRDYRLLVVGDGIRASWMREECGRAAPGAVTFQGHVGSRESLALLYANADAFVHPNPREPFGIAPLEAMASGLPLVAPNSGGVTTYAKPDNAWLAEPHAAAFADAVRSAVEDHELRRQRTTAARAKAASLNWPTVADQFLELYGAIDALANGRAVDQALAPQFVSTP
jgi:alpha-1,6-mannosyltransferase